MAKKKFSELELKADEPISLRTIIPISDKVEFGATLTTGSATTITWTNHGIPVDNTVTFTFPMGMPTGIAANTPYYVISEGYTLNSFQISETKEGTPLVTGGNSTYQCNVDAYVSRALEMEQLKKEVGANQTYIVAGISKTKILPGVAGIATTINHGLATYDILVEVWDVAKNELVYVDVRNRQLNSVDVVLDYNPTGEIEVVVSGRSIVTAPVIKYYEYKAKVSQAGTNAPTLTVLNNTFPDDAPYGDYDDIGHYRVYIPYGLPLPEKTEVRVDMGIMGGTAYFSYGRKTVDSLEILTQNSNRAFANGLLNDNTLTVRYYYQ